MLPLLLAVLYWFSSSISRSIIQIAQETEKISTLDLNNIKAVKSPHKEIETINRSLAMSVVGLKAFRKYLPKEVVNSLISAKLRPEIGGVEKNMTVMFTDINDFTKISEYMGADELAYHLSDYFSYLVKMVEDLNGTVDKFIGDSMMVFWESNDSDSSAQINACQAACSIKALLPKLNKEWAEMGKPCLYSRLGINTGKCMVGNIGAPERLNYTIIGDAINLASRLEAINKVYNTEIIISHDTYMGIKDHFYTRKLDLIAVKGKIESSMIYELIAHKSEDIPEHWLQIIDWYETALEKYFLKDWKKAIELLNKIPDGSHFCASRDILLKRCHNFSSCPNSVSENWNGVFSYNEKNTVKLSPSNNLYIPPSSIERYSA